MKMYRFVLCVLGFCFTLGLSTAPLSAHDMWLQPAEEGIIIALGHQGAIDPYEPDRVREVYGYTENNWPVELDILRGKDGCRVFADEPFVAYTSILDNKYWYNTPESWKNQRDGEGLKIVEEGRSYKYTKHIAGWAEFLSKPLGQRIEIVPLKDPTSMKPGDRLPVKIYFEGEPLYGSGVRISETSSMDATHSLKNVEKEGPLMVEIGSPGFQLVNAKYEMPLEGKKRVWFACSLTFKVGK